MNLMIAEQYQQFLKSYHIDVNQLLLEVGIKNQLVDERVEVSLLENYRFLLAIDHIFTEEMVWEISSLEHSHLFVQTFLAALLAKDGFTALKNFVNYQSFICPNEFDIQETKTAVSLSVRYPENILQLPKFAILFTQLSLLEILRKGSGKMIVPLAIESPYHYDEETETVIGKAAKVTQGSNLLVFSKEDLSREYVTHGREAWWHLQAGLDKELSSGQFVFSTRTELQAIIFRMLQEGQVSIETVAEELGMSVRTLQRRLVEEGTSYQAEVQSVKLDLAIYYMKQGFSTEEITDWLGYTELAAFSRSFKKWTGENISDFRKKIGLS